MDHSSDIYNIRTWWRSCVFASRSSFSRRFVRTSATTEAMYDPISVVTPLAPAGTLLFTHNHGTKLLALIAQIDSGFKHSKLSHRASCSLRRLPASMESKCVRRFLPSRRVRTLLFLPLWLYSPARLYHSSPAVLRFHGYPKQETFKGTIRHFISENMSWTSARKSRSTLNELS